MSNFKKLMMTAAGGGEGLNVEEVFSTYLYDGNGSTKTITNDIDLSTEGGMVWVKNRKTSYSNQLFDTERGATKYLVSNLNNGEYTATNSLTSFNTDGFSLSDQASVNTAISTINDFASWTFRKAPKFFDVVTWTGDGTTGRQISHNLDHTVGMMILKSTDRSGYWGVYHRSTDSTAPEDYVLILGSTSGKIDEQFFINDTAPTSTHFTVGSTAASGGDFNTNGATYVAYLFAHNDGDGDFGPTGDQDIIKCGSYSGDNSGNGFVDLGWEPQWILIKRSNSSGSWYVVDNMRGWTADGTMTYLFPNDSSKEFPTSTNVIAPTATGFSLGTSSSGAFNTSGGTYIYMAIRRGPMAVPEIGSKVFWMSNLDGAEPTYNSNNFPVDMAIHRHIGAGADWHLVDRQRAVREGDERYLEPNTSQIDGTNGAYINGEMDYMNGWASAGNNTSYQSWMWRRAPSYFDIVAWKGTSSSTQTLNHNLGVVPEMIWFKNRDDTDGWFVYHTETGNAKSLVLNSATSEIAQTTYLNSTTPTDTTFTVGNVLNWSSSFKYIAYLFASTPGVSKVGSFTGNGTSQTIDCGFSSGARFVLIKGLTTGSHWELWDTKRGISAGVDSHLNLNNANPQAYDDSLDPHNSGFIVNQVSTTNVNVSSQTYIFYAIA
jgi:hypothetical protein